MESHLFISKAPEKVIPSEWSAKMEITHTVVTWFDQENFPLDTPGYLQQIAFRRSIALDWMLCRSSDHMFGAVDELSIWSTRGSHESGLADAAHSRSYRWIYWSKIG